VLVIREFNHRGEENAEFLRNFSCSVNSVTLAQQKYHHGDTEDTEKRRKKNLTAKRQRPLRKEKKREEKRRKEKKREEKRRNLIP
jgi:hypothetical protein